MEVKRIADPYDKDHSASTQRKVLNYLKQRQTVQQLLSPYRSEIPVYINPKKDTPLKVVHTGDNHFAHDAADPDSLPTAVKETGKTGLLALHANIIDSVSNKFLKDNTIRVGLDLDQQSAFVRGCLFDLDSQGRVIPMSGNFCHEGWPRKTATHDPVLDMVSRETPILFAGGQVNFVTPENPDQPLGIMENYHNPGKGPTRLSPEGGARARSQELPFGQSKRAGAIFTAHTHYLVACQDVIYDPIRNQTEIASYGVVGSPKGTDINPDSFLVGLGVSPRNQPGDCEQGLTSEWTNHRHPDKLDCYPVAGYRRGEKLHQAVSLWELAASSGNLENLLGEITASLSQPNLEFIEQESLRRESDPAAFTEGSAPLYKATSHRIETTLPVRVHFIGGLRVGSSSFRRERTKEILDGIEDNPLAYCYATRRLINQSTSQRGDRLEVLDDLAEILGRANSSLLGVMLTDELRIKKWAKPTKHEMKALDLTDSSDWMPPGDQLYFDSPIAGTPIIMPETVSRLKVGDTDYTIYLRDKLSHFTSLINPEHGLSRIQQIWGINADLLAGGHTEVVGWRTWMRPWGQLEIVVPGGFSEFMEKGVGNRTDYPEGAQGSILFPKERLLYSFATYDQGCDLHDAFVLQEGLTQLGTLDQTKRKLKKHR